MHINTEAAAANYGLVPLGANTLKRWAPGLDEQDSHDIATNALIRATRNHPEPPWPLYLHCLTLALADWARSPRHANGRTRAGNERLKRRDLDDRRRDLDGKDDWLAVEHRDFRAIDARDEAEAAMRPLSARQRSILEMEHIGGYYRREIAERFGVSETTVFHELAAARAVLRRLPIPPRNRRKGA